MNYRSFDDLSRDIRNHLYEIHSGNYDLVVGIPRSGMIPAYMVGLYLNIYVTDFEGFLLNRELKKGITRTSKNNLDRAHDAINVLMIDDSIMSGQSLQHALDQLPENLKSRVTTMAIYSDRTRRSDVDKFLEYVPSPRVFEWNIFHHSVLSKACVDIDGVLCVDPTNEENDDGEMYLNFLTNAKSHFIPSYRIHSLVTSRLEKYRLQTENWLKTKGIQYDNLIMLDLPSKADRQKLQSHGMHKATYFKNNADLVIFIESDYAQAQEIMYLTSKPVYCVDMNTMLVPGVISSAVKNPRLYADTLKKRILKKMPHSLVRMLKPIYKAVFKL